jgi:hypothetical protein
VVSIDARSTEGGNKTAEGPDAGEGAKAVGIPQPSQYLSCVDCSDAGDRHDVRWITLLEKRSIALIKLMDLLVELERIARFDRNVIGQLSVVDLVRPGCDNRWSHLHRSR